MATRKIDPEWLERYGHKPSFDDIWLYFGYYPPTVQEYGEPKQEPQKTCFAYEPKEKSGCKALKMLYCRHEECSFYKPKDQYEKELANASRMGRQNICV